MKTIFNFGDPHKDFAPVADEILGSYKTISIPITNNKLFYNGELQIVDAAYGPSMVLDSLTMLEKIGNIKKGDEIIFLGSMGSLSSRLNLDDLVVPYALHCTDWGNKGKILKPDPALLESIETALKNSSTRYKIYEHGSVMAVFDPTSDHVNYTHSRYGKNVEGIDCSESYLGIQFCEKNQMRGAILLYCSDDPMKHIGDISKKDFDERALKIDLGLHCIAKRALLN